MGVDKGVVSWKGLEGGTGSILASESVSKEISGTIWASTSVSVESAKAPAPRASPGTSNSPAIGEEGSVRGDNEGMGSLLAAEISERESKVGVKTPSSDRGVVATSGTSLRVVSASNGVSAVFTTVGGVVSPLGVALWKVSGYQR